ncbi:hypothetical protein [Raineyella fluvialis]|uniref:Uncharacterized protein n=1 Tax=Raineyella fluvialis TaxID=2662261 RepID=A0A5Q2FAA4_9ACTN|nr:hypothetical protein [Raineyella fluvialis]QGF22667.1 hypothetical protein Rai3103_02075 [Raineyella fluvialis]
MGLDPAYPYVGINDLEHGHATVYDELHRPIGRLGPSPYESPHTNVTCILRAWECRDWYKLLNPVSFSPTAAEGFVSASETSPGPYSLPIPRCAARRFCWAWWWVVLALAVLATVAVGILRKKNPPDPPPDVDLDEGEPLDL